MVFRRAFVRKTCLPPSCTLRGQKLCLRGRFWGPIFEVDASIWGRNFCPESIFGVAGVENFGPKNGSCHRFREKKVVFLRGVGVPRVFGPKKRNLGSHEGGYGRSFLGSGRVWGRVGPRLVGRGHFGGP